MRLLTCALQQTGRQISNDKEKEKEKEKAKETKANQGYFSSCPHFSSPDQTNRRGDDDDDDEEVEKNDMQ